MRTGKDVFGWGSRNYDGESNAIDVNGNPIPLYSVVTPSEVKCFTEYLRAAGYYCTNNSKTDYQFAAPVTAWDQNGNEAHWKNRRKTNYFFLFLILTLLMSQKCGFIETNLLRRSKKSSFTSILSRYIYSKK